MIREELLFANQYGSPLIFLIPGGTGSKRIEKRGYVATASYFWLRGYSAYIAETAGQDGNPGVFSLTRCLDECKSALKSLIQEYGPSRVILFGSCSGGTVATHLATDDDIEIDGLALWETLPVFEEPGRLEFVSRATGVVTLSDNFFGEYLETADKAGKVKCAVLSLYGDKQAPPVFFAKDAEEIKRIFSSAESLESHCFSGADHNLVRGTNPTLLHEILQYIDTRLSGPSQQEVLQVNVST